MPLQAGTFLWVPETGLGLEVFGPRRQGEGSSVAAVDEVLHRRLILSQTSAGKGGDYVIDSLLALRCSFFRA
jgi:hypothetical protein